MHHCNALVLAKILFRLGVGLLLKPGSSHIHNPASALHMYIFLQDLLAKTGSACIARVAKNKVQ